MYLSSNKIKAYSRLMRFHQPTGIFLLLWPTLWAAHLATISVASLRWWLLVAGVVLTRAAGCIVNDYWDRDIDGCVDRTRRRPLVTGDISLIEARLLVLILLALALGCAIALNVQVVLLSIPAVCLLAVYPLAKRFIPTPQIILGMAFGWSIPMAFACQSCLEAQWPLAILLYSITLCWVVIYDTQYALADKADDCRLQVYSTAILFGQSLKEVLAVLMSIMIGLLVKLGYACHYGSIYYLSVTLVGLAFVYQHKILTPATSWYVFQSHQYIGGCLYLGLLFGTL